MEQTTTGTFADDTIILASHKDPKEASRKLQDNITEIQKWLKTWRIKVNEQKSLHVTFTLNKETCPPVTLNNRVIPQAETAKYLGIHLDQRLTWKTHIWSKRKQLGLKLRNMYWLLVCRSKLSLNTNNIQYTNKVLLYKSIITPLWTYGIQLWGSDSNSNIDILERFQSKVLRILVDAPWFMTNDIIRRDLDVATVKEVKGKYASKYIVRLDSHPNQLANELLNETTDKRRLKRFKPLDSTKRFK